MKVQIDLGTWLRGEGGGSLLTTDGTRCCLGFLGKACGVSDEDMLGCSIPYFTVDRDLFPAELSRRQPVPMEEALAKINDAKGVDDAERMAWIVEGFRRLTAPDGTPCEVEWVGGET